MEYPLNVSPVPDGAAAAATCSHRGYTSPMDDSRTIIIAHVATLGVFKLVTSVMILYFFPSWHALIVIVALSIPWIVAGIWYGGLYSRVRVRLVRGRRRRALLIHQEWNVD